MIVGLNMTDRWGRVDMLHNTDRQHAIQSEGLNARKGEESPSNEILQLASNITTL